jgi:type II secretory pathway pseudopilin PulG
MTGIGGRGFTLAEMLMVIVTLAAVAAVSVPMLSANDPQKLNVAAEEVANLLRFAVSEAQRTGGYVMVDGKTVPGHLRIYYSDATGHVPPTAGTTEVNDPLTKRAADLDVGASAFSPGVTLTPRFMGGGTARPQLLIGPGLTQLQAFDGITEGVLGTGSGVLLSLGGQSATIAISELSGLVTVP